MISTSGNQVADKCQLASNLPGHEESDCVTGSREKSWPVLSTQRDSQVLYTERLGVVSPAEIAESLISPGLGNYGVNDNDNRDIHLATTVPGNFNISRGVSQWNRRMPDVSSTQIGDVEPLPTTGQGTITASRRGNKITRITGKQTLYNWQTEGTYDRNLGKRMITKDVNTDTSTASISNISNTGSSDENTSTNATYPHDSEENMNFVNSKDIPYDTGFGPLNGSEPLKQIRRSLSDEVNVKDLAVEALPLSNSARSHNHTGWRKGRVDQDASDDLQAESSTRGRSSFLDIGRISIQQLARKLGIRAPQKQDEQSQRRNEESDGVDNTISCAKASSPGRPVDSRLVVDEADAPSVSAAKLPTVSRETVWDGGSGSLQGEVIKEVIVDSTGPVAYKRAFPPSSGNVQGVESNVVERDRNWNKKKSPVVNSTMNFQRAEEDFQLQLALALRVSAEAAAVDDPNLTAQAKETAGNYSLVSTVEATAYRYWVNNCLGYKDRIEDGFYAVWGMSSYVWSMCTDSDEFGRMPPLENLRSVNPLDATFEVTLVERAIDMNLRELEERVVVLGYGSAEFLDMASKLSILVSNSMGGPSESDEHLEKLWRSTQSTLVQMLGSIVVPIGQISVGLSRHRALLFKFLADSIHMPCRIVRGSAFCGKEEDFMVLVKSEDERETMVDLMVNPGTTRPPDARYVTPPAVIPSPLQFERPRRYGGSSSIVKDWVRPEEAESEGVSFRPASPNRSELGTVLQPAQAVELPVVTQGLAFAQEVSVREPKGGTSGSGDLAGRDRMGFVNLQKQSEWKQSEWKTRLERKSAEGAAQPSHILEDIMQITGSPDNLPDASGVNAKLETSTARQETPQVEAVLDQIASEASDVEIAWDDVIIGERIGQGSYGKVYRADWQGSDVAVKVFLDQDLKKEALEEFKREVAIMRRLRHPNIVLFMGAVTKPPNLSIITEFCPRGSLYRLLHRPNRELDERRRLRMAVDVVKGMNYLHRCTPPVVHRDLKSPNLLVDKNWTVKVGDFGLSRQKHSTFLSSKSSAGTPEWMAPEVLRNEPSDEKSDVYSFGVILWELATLQVPWNGMSAIQVVGAVGFQHRRLPTDNIDPPLAALIQACWRTDSKMRPSFADLMVELKTMQMRPMTSPSHSPSHTPRNGP